MNYYSDDNQGKTLKKIVDCPYLYAVLQENAVQRYTINLDCLPPFDDEDACAAYEAPLCRDFSNIAKSSRTTSGRTVMPVDSGASTGDVMPTEAREMDEDESGNEGPVEGETGDTSDLVSPFLSASS